MHLSSPPSVQEYGFGGWGIAFWIGTFNAVEDHEWIENASLCQGVVDELLRLLEAIGPVDFSMAPIKWNDVYGDAPLSWNGCEFKVGFNVMDGVVSIDHPNREPLDHLLKSINGSLHAAAND